MIMDKIVAKKWKAVRLGDTVSYISRGVTPHYVEADGFMVLNQKCIRNNRVLFEEARLTDRNIKVGSEKFLKKYDVLVNSTGVGTLGRVAQFKEEEIALVDSHITIVRPRESLKEGLKIDPEYFGYSVVEKQSLIESFGAGATGQTELSRERLKREIILMFPDFQLQKKITAFLVSYDNLIENNVRRIQILEQIALTIYTEWFVDFHFP